MLKLWTVAVLSAPVAVCQSPAATMPRFEVVSVKPCTGEPPVLTGRKRASGGSISGSPDRLWAECATLRTLIRAAYITFADGGRWFFVSPRVLQQDIKGAPAWIDSARFDIQAKAAGPQKPEMLRGPMLQSLLEERFGLRIHREPRDVPIYELKVGKGGPKFAAAKPGGCSPLDPEHPPDPKAGRPMRICGAFAGYNMYGTTMENLARQLTATGDRDVVDKTGLAGSYDLHFQFPPEDLTPGVDPSDRFGSRLVRAIPRLGLRLAPTTGSAEFLVIDAVTLPSEN